MYHRFYEQKDHEGLKAAAMEIVMFHDWMGGSEVHRRMLRATYKSAGR
jgi:hypothetical protein